MANTKANRQGRRSSQNGASQQLKSHTFTRDGRLLAVLSPHDGKDRLRVWSVSPETSPSESSQSSSTPTELLSDIVLPDVQVRSFAWIESVEPKRQKRRSSANDSRPPACQLALGTQDGRVLLFSPSRAAVTQVLVDDSLPVSERTVLSVSSYGDHLFAGYADGAVRVFDLKEGAATVSSPTLRIPLPNSAQPWLVAANQTGFLVGDKEVAFYPLDNSTAIDRNTTLTPSHSIPVHGDSLTKLVWIGPRRFLAAVHGSTEARIWNVSESNQNPTVPVGHFNLGAPIQTLAFFGYDGADHAKVVAVTTTGVASLFLIPPTLDLPNSSDSGKKPRKSKQSGLHPTSSVTGSESPASIVDAAVDILPSGKTTMTVARSRASDVLFSTAMLRNSKDQVFAHSVQFSASDEAPATQSITPTELIVGQVQPESQRDSPLDVEMEVAEQSLETRLKGLDIPTSVEPDANTPAGSAVTPGISLGKVDATGLARALTEALNSSNQAMTTELLANMHFSASVAKGAIKRLVGPVAVALLEATLHRLQASSADTIRTHRLIQWARLALITHTRYMMTLPTLVDRLANLHAALEARLANQDKFIELQGRLDLVLAQLEARARLAEQLQGGTGNAPQAPDTDDVVHGQEDGDTQDVALDADDSGPDSAEEEEGDQDDSEAMKDNGLESSSAPDDSQEQADDKVDASHDDHEPEDDEVDEAGSLGDFIADGEDDESDEESEDESSNDEDEAQPSNGKASGSKAARGFLDEEAEESSDEEEE